ncbi:SDR family oxidoreductase [Mechercharimyces sp. CAU 1602]|uniref:SDR family oxidoreductase n=1 Tax=Mechercharimyces sp. CAU 1602 TaxID=2973933 RepID=UPI0021630B80|nr:SDR family NAD(P)-dependent oxidoreductase [Mechercharimyces sp. CAU 1602]MCS1350935.1 SDR family NAD(P)-dependent oxidoreductase [Mechercharimyces sp. CAU 1602]
MEKIEGHVAIVTGASRGLGRAIATRLAQEGVFVMAAARHEGELQQLSQEHPRQITPVQCDITSSAQVKQLVQQTIDQHGKLDFLINNAGLGRFAPVHELDESDWDDMMNVNLKGSFLTCKYAIPHLITQRGHIVNISSVAGTVTFAGGAGYCASKFGLGALSNVLTEELKPHQVKVSTLCPGSIQTYFSNKEKPYALQPEQVANTVWTILSADEGVIYNQVIMRPQVPPQNM